MIYLDYAANTTVDKEVLDVFNKVSLEYFANPNSSHKLGKESARIIEESTEKISKILKCDADEIIYTSGATEANNLVLKGISERYKNKGKHILLGSLEHNSILSSSATLQNEGFEVEIININNDGLIDLDDLKNKFRDDTILVSVCAVDSELGIRQPIEEIGNFLKEYDTFFHSDLSQSFGKVDIDTSNCDLITITPHKFYGLNGVGILVKRKSVSLKPQIEGGKSTTIYRSGTPTTALIAASSKAIEKAYFNIDKNLKYIEKLNNKIITHLKKYNNIVINSRENSLPHFINISIRNIKNTKFVEKLENNEVYISTKTSCCPVQTPSKLVYALTKDKTLASTSLRISLSHLTTEKEVDSFLEIFDKCYKELKSGEV